MTLINTLNFLYHILYKCEKNRFRTFILQVFFWNMQNNYALYEVIHLFKTSKYAKICKIKFNISDFMSYETNL